MGRPFWIVVVAFAALIGLVLAWNVLRGVSSAGLMALTGGVVGGSCGLLAAFVHRRRHQR